MRTTEPISLEEKRAKVTKIAPAPREISPPPGVEKLANRAVRKTFPQGPGNPNTWARIPAPAYI